jgi:hypothetical protein
MERAPQIAHRPWTSSLDLFEDGMFLASQPTDLVDSDLVPSIYSASPSSFLANLTNEQLTEDESMLSSSTFRTTSVIICHLEYYINILAILAYSYSPEMLRSALKHCVT